MKLTRDHDCNVAYLSLADESIKVDSTVPVFTIGGQLNLDLNERGALLGIEFLEADVQLLCAKRKEGRDTCPDAARPARVNAIETLRSDHADFSVSLDFRCSPQCVVCAALAKVETLLQAAERVGHADNPTLGEFPWTEKGAAALREMTSALEALAAAIRDVKGDGT